jgi:GTP-binding protein
LDALVEALPEQEPDTDEEDEAIRIAVLGRPNTGKSTLVNKLLGEERVIASPIPGTTRDAIDTPLVWHGQPFTLIDTAGIRRRGRIDPGVEKYSVLRAIKALGRADVALLMIDISEGVTAQDLHVGGMLAEANCGAIVLINKWDLVEKDTYTMNDMEQEIRKAFDYLAYAPLLFISAQTGQRVNKILPLVQEVNAARFQRVPTSALNRMLREAVYNHPPSRGGKDVRFYYATQPSTAPPVFVFFVNKPEWVHFTYQRYLENQLREAFAFPGTPVRLIFRPRSGEGPGAL